MKVDQIIIERYGSLSVVKNGVEFKQFCPFNSSEHFVGNVIVDVSRCNMNCPLFSPLRKHGEVYFLEVCKKTLWSDQVRIDAPGFELRGGWEDPEDVPNLNEED